MPEFQPAQLQAWLAALHAGQVTAAPAEGVYGYTANPFNPKALQSLLELKQRDPSKGFILLIPNLESLSQLCPPLPEASQKAIATTWPTPTTIILPALKTIPDLLTGGKGTLAVRLPQVGYVREYLEAWNAPLVSTSLNLSGQPPATEAAQIPQGIPALTLPHPLSGTPSRILNPQTDQWLR